jgi:LysM repeat protein
MVDKKNLNRIKRVLSAGNGAELPKYTVKPGDTLSQIVLNYNKTNNTNFTW